MPDPVAPTGPPAKGKKKGSPRNTYIIGGLVLVAGYWYYAKKKAAAAAAATPATAAAASPVGSGSSAGTAASSYGNAGDLAALAPYLTNMSGVASTDIPTSTTTPPTLGTNGLPSVGSMSGSGFLPSGVTNPAAPNPGTLTAQDTSGNLFTWLNPQQAQGYQGTEYYEPVPGTFTPITPAQWGSVGANTPLYGMVGNGVAST
jgi:hypothetical protein